MPRLQNPSVWDVLKSQPTVFWIVLVLWLVLDFSLPVVANRGFVWIGNAVQVRALCGTLVLIYGIISLLKVYIAWIASLRPETRVSPDVVKYAGISCGVFDLLVLVCVVYCLNF